MPSFMGRTSTLCVALCARREQIHRRRRLLVACEVERVQGRVGLVEPYQFMELTAPSLRQYTDKLNENLGLRLCSQLRHQA